MLIPSCDTLWRTDTGHCIAQTMMALPAELNNITTPTQIEIQTKSPDGDTSTSAKLTLSPTPVVDAVEARADFLEVKKESATSGSEMIKSMSADHDLRSESFGKLNDGGDVSSPQLRKKSHTFIYRWFHTHNDEHKIKNAGSEDSVRSSSSSISDSTPSRKHTLIYRLFHHENEHYQPGHHHTHQSHDHSGLVHYHHDAHQNGESSQARASNGNCVGVHPDPSDVLSPHAQHRHAILYRLFHHVHQDSSETSSATSSSIWSRKKLPGMEMVTSGRASATTSMDNLQTSPKSVASQHKLNGAKDDGGSADSSVKSVKSVNSSRRSSKKSHEDDSGAGTPKLKTSESTELRRSGLSTIFKSLLLPPKNRHSAPVPESPSMLAVDHPMDKYGHAEKVIGKGAGGTVRLFHKESFNTVHSHHAGQPDVIGPDDKQYAVKVKYRRICWLISKGIPET